MYDHCYIGFVYNHVPAFAFDEYNTCVFTENIHTFGSLQMWTYENNSNLFTLYCYICILDAKNLFARTAAIARKRQLSGKQGWCRNQSKSCRMLQLQKMVEGYDPVVVTTVSWDDDDNYEAAPPVVPNKEDGQVTVNINREKTYVCNPGTALKAISLGCSILISQG
jgi:hypothetical protein